MSRIADQSYLLSDQYKDGSNLDARRSLYERFSVNKHDWFRWVFDHLTITSNSNILELGCGTGRLWLNNLDRIPGGCCVLLSDFSPGMVQEASKTLRSSSHTFDFQIIDAQSIPLKDKSFDTVIANHMLFHVPDMEKALSEVSRVLKPDGYFYASTKGHMHMSELTALIKRFEISLSFWDNDMLEESFTLENGHEKLSRFFKQITTHRLKDELKVTEAEALVDCVLSTYAKRMLTGDRCNEFRAFVKHEFDNSRAFCVTKDVGLFIANN